MLKNNTEKIAHVMIFITFQNTSTLISKRMVNIEWVGIYLLRKMTH